MSSPHAIHARVIDQDLDLVVASIPFARRLVMVGAAWSPGQP